MAMSSATRSLHLATRVLRSQTRSAAVLSSAFLQTSSAPTVAFVPASRQPSLQLTNRRAYSSAALTTSNMPYDKEIDDIAEYVQNPIDSELAVGSLLFPLYSIIERIV